MMTGDNGGTLGERGLGRFSSSPGTFGETLCHRREGKSK